MQKDALVQSASALVESYRHLSAGPPEFELDADPQWHERPELSRKTATSYGTFSEMQQNSAKPSSPALRTTNCINCLLSNFYQKPKDAKEVGS